jgi:TolA-binding protein
VSKVIDQEQPLSDEDRRYLEERGNYALIKTMDDRHGTGPEQEQETEESLAQQVSELESQINDLEGRRTQLRIAREQQEAGVKDNTVVDGEGGSENRTDDYDEAKWTRASLQAEIDKRNEGRDNEDKMSSSGTKAQLIERLRADDAAYPEGYFTEDEDDEDEE